MMVAYESLVTGASAFIGGVFIGAYIATPTEILMRAGLDTEQIAEQGRKWRRMTVRQMSFISVPAMPLLRGLLFMLVIFALGFLGALGLMRIGGVVPPLTANRFTVFSVMLIVGVLAGKLGRYWFWIAQLRR